NVTEAAATKRLGWPVWWFLATVEFATDVRTIRNVQSQPGETIWYAGCVHAIIYESITYLPNFWSTDSKRSTRPYYNLVQLPALLLATPARE
ncbi:hypothetical protein K0M31_004479, partial [Melipona bicolor]